MDIDYVMSVGPEGRTPSTRKLSTNRFTSPQKIKGYPQWHVSLQAWPPLFPPDMGSARDGGSKVGVLSCGKAAVTARRWRLLQ